MQLESQVCSLDLAKRLKELGVKQESLFWYNYIQAHADYELDYDKGGSEYLSAFTVAELLEILGNDFYMITRYSANKDFNVCSQPDDPTQHKTHDKNLVNALAQLAINLLQPNLRPEKD